MLSTNNCILNEYINKKFKIKYPNIEINNLDSELFENMVITLLDDDYKNINNMEKIPFKFDNNIKENILLANKLIPEMLDPSNLIYLNGKINNNKINIMINTSASTCVIYKSVIKKFNLEYLIDKSSYIMAQGIQNINPILGTIWIFDIELDISNGKGQYITIPISAEVIDDSDIIDKNKIINDKLIKMKNIIEDKKISIDIIQELNNKKNFELILGMNFLKSYKANIDFSSMILTLNKNINIKLN
jgi:hypothetical protein